MKWAVVRGSTATLPRWGAPVVSKSRPYAQAPDRDIPQEGEALRHHLPALPRARLPRAGTTLRAIRGLGLRPGDSVVDIACGTGLNFTLIEQKIGPDGRIVGVDLTDAMLAQAQDRIEKNGWSNISLVQADAADFEFPTKVDAILSTYALTPVPECADVIAHRAAGLSVGGRWVVLDLKIPVNVPRWLARLGTSNRSALRVHRSVDHAPSVGRDSRSHAGRTRNLPGTNCSSGLHFSPPALAALDPVDEIDGKGRVISRPAEVEIALLARRVSTRGPLQRRATLPARRCDRATSTIPLQMLSRPFQCVA